MEVVLNTRKEDATYDDLYQKLQSIKNQSKTAYYYLAVLLAFYDDDEIGMDEEVFLNDGEGNLFVDYLLIKKKYFVGEELTDRKNCYKRLAPVYDALKELSDLGMREAMYLYADLCYYDNRVPDNISVAYGLFSRLAQVGHIAASYKLAKIIMTYPDKFKDKLSTIEPSLLNARHYHHRRAEAMLYKFYEEGIKGYIKPNPEKAMHYKDSLIPTRFSYFVSVKHEDLPEDHYQSQIMKTASEIFDTKKVEYPFIDAELHQEFLKEYLPLRNKKNAYLKAYAKLEDIKENEPFFFNAEKAVLSVNLGNKTYAHRYIKQMEKYLNDDYKDKWAKHLGDLYLKCARNKKEAQKALDYYKRAAHLGNMNVAFYLGYLYQGYKKGHIEKNKELSEKYYLIAADGCYSNAFIHAANIMESRGDIKKSIEYLERGSSLNSPACHLKLADLYYNGVYKSKDLRKAIHYYFLSYQMLSPRGTYMLGYMIKNGEGAKADEKTGNMLMKRGIIYGYNGHHYDDGMSLKDKKPQKAMNEFKKQLEIDEDRYSASELGDMYFEGKHVRRSYSKAYKYYKIAEKSNDKNALYHLGLLYKGGHGVTKSLSKAFKYFEKASMQDVPDAFYQAGITAYKLKRYQDAQIYLEQAKGENNPYAYYLLSEMHYFDKIKNANTKDAEYYGRLAKSFGFKPSIKLKSKAN